MIPAAFRTLLAAAVAVVLPVCAHAQITFGADTIGASPLSLSISGGISLGSYQAGVNYGLLEVYRHAAWNPDFRRDYGVPRYRLRSVTGASAGNINTLLWALEACTDMRDGAGVYRSPDPSTSLFWNVWLEIGWDRLFDINSPELALFDRTALTDVARPLIEERMKDRRLYEGCKVPAGITLTRITPGTIQLQDLPIETQRHVTAFDVAVDSRAAPLGTRVRFRQAERLENDDQHLGILVRLHPHDGDVFLETMLEAVKASASFPVAFAPVELTVWYPGGGTESHHFVDGGFFDNNPVGLARSLYEANGGRDTLDILYVDPDRYRSRLARDRHVRREPTPNGGLAAVMATMQGAVPTARQYELQLLARERAFRKRETLIDAELRRQDINVDSVRVLVGADTVGYRSTERLLLSSRAYPVLGEHLGAFGGFLARPGREFDFYVGLYDGLYMAAWHHTCSGFSVGTELGRQQRHRCVGYHLPNLLTDSLLVRDPARQVLARLYEMEFAPMELDVGPPHEDLSDRVTVQLAFLSALGTQFIPASKEQCADKRIASAVLCRDGLLQVLSVLNNDLPAREILSAWHGQCGKECTVERQFVALIRDPMAASTQMLDGLARRLAHVERLMQVRRDAEGDDYLKPVLGAQWLFEASYLRSRPLLDWRPSSIPATSALRKSPVSYLGANLGASGVEARFNPTFNVFSARYLRVNAILHHNGEPKVPDERVFAGFGVGVGQYFPNILASELGFSANVFRPLNNLVGAPIPELEAHVTVLADQLRISARVLPNRDHHGRLHGPRGFTFAAGLNDPLGLVYWISRLIR